MATSTESRHTPGPWTGRGTVRLDGTYYIETVVNPWLVAEVAGQGARNEANARLIAAAPELLEALEDVLDRMGALTNPSELEGYMNSKEDADRIFAAFKKARGG